MKNQKDLLVLVAGQNDKAVLDAILKRHQSLQIREITLDVIKHPNHDSGIVNHGHELLRTQRRKYCRFICICDYEGSGKEEHSPNEIEQELQERLNGSNFIETSAVVVIDPELESWIWKKPEHIDRALEVSKNDRIELLKKWYKDFDCRTSLEETIEKYPKEAFEFLLKAKKIPRSSRIYENIASEASIIQWMKCPSFEKLARVLRKWFPK